MKKKGTHMSMEPLIEKPEMIRKSTHDLALLIAQHVYKAGISEETERYYLSNKDQTTQAIRRGFSTVVDKDMEAKKHDQLIDLSGTIPTFGDWLKAREELHKFLTGEIVILRDMFVIPKAIFARIDIIPVFRPTGATNRMAVDWKKKLGIDVREETDVMEYENSKGPKVPQLSFINRSITPDADTLGKSPIDLRKVRMKSNQAWLNLYGWSDAHSLYFKIIGKHLDGGNTWTWFPDDVLPDGEVASGRWRPSFGRVEFGWYDAVSCNDYFGARLAEFFPLKK